MFRRTATYLVTRRRNFRSGCRHRRGIEYVLEKGRNRQGIRSGRVCSKVMELICRIAHTSVKDTVSVCGLPYTLVAYSKSSDSNEVSEVYCGVD